MQYSNGKIHSGHGDYTRDIFIGLGFFNRTPLRKGDVFFLLFVCLF